MRRGVAVGLAALCVALIALSTNAAPSYAFVWRHRKTHPLRFLRPKVALSVLRNMQPADGMPGVFYSYHWVNGTSSDSFSFSWESGGSTWYVEANINKSYNVFLVTILYDHDRSLEPFIVNGTRPVKFTGDEVFTHTSAILVRVSGTVSWSGVSSGTCDFQSAHAIFIVEQLRVRSASISGDTVTVTGDVLRHHLVALLAFQDQDHDGALDLSVEDGTITGEAVYKFRPTDFGVVSVETPSVKDGELAWKVTVEDISGELLPIATQEYGPSGAFYGPGGPPTIAEHIDKFEYTFHFTTGTQDVGGTAYYVATLKVDTYIGEWSDKTPLSGLSMALTYLTVEADFYRSVTHKATDETGNPCPGDKAEVRKATRLVFYADGEAVGDVIFGGNTYVWNGVETVNATSSITPLALMTLSFSGVTPGASWTVEVNATTHLYSACYPKWDGYSIDHDPYFTMCSAPVTAQAGLVGLLKHPLFIGGVVAAAAVIGAVVIAYRRKKYTNSRQKP